MPHSTAKWDFSPKPDLAKPSQAKIAWVHIVEICYTKLAVLVNETFMLSKLLRRL